MRDEEILGMYNSFVKDMIEYVGKEEFDEYYSIEKIKSMGKAYVYILHNKDTGLYKIGCTKDLEKRLKQIKNTFKNTLGVEHQLDFFAVVECYNGWEFKIEKLLHNGFDEYRKFGEWFDLNKDKYLYDTFDTQDIRGGIRYFSCFDFMCLDECIDIYKKEKYEITMKDLGYLIFVPEDARYIFKKINLRKSDNDIILTNTINTIIKSLKIT